MKTIALEEMLKRIDSLPWPRGASVLLIENKDATTYAIHAINVLPELVKAAREFQQAVYTHGGASSKLCDNLQNALSNAENIPIE